MQFRHHTCSRTPSTSSSVVVEDEVDGVLDISSSFHDIVVARGAVWIRINMSEQQRRTMLT